MKPDTSEIESELIVESPARPRRAPPDLLCAVTVDRGRLFSKAEATELLTPIGGNP